jgi:hypothetical protein
VYTLALSKNSYRLMLNHVEYIVEDVTNKELVARILQLCPKVRYCTMTLLAESEGVEPPAV